MKFIKEVNMLKHLEKFHPVVRDINKWFKFLFDRGFKIKYTNFKQNRMMFWSVFLESTDCIIHVFQDRNEIFVSYAPLIYLIEGNGEYRLKDEFAIQIMIFYISHGKVFIGSFEKEVYRRRNAQLKTISKLIETYHDSITPCFSKNEFQMKKDEIEIASRDFNKIQFDKYVLGKKTGY